MLKQTARTNMKYLASALVLLSLFTIFAYGSGSKKQKNVPLLIEWDSKESMKRISRSPHKIDFFPLSNHFASQENKIFCGLTAAAIVLNALHLGKSGNLPEDQQSIEKKERAWLPKGFNPFLRKYTTRNVLNDQTKRKAEVLGRPIKIKGKMKKDYGLQLRQLAQVLRSNRTKVTVRIVNEAVDIKSIRVEIIKNLVTKDDYVLINYARKALGQKGGGHISPLGAYDQQSDSFLIMDVNPNKAPWVWVKFKDLISAMRTFDTIENRGYLLIAEKD